MKPPGWLLAGGAVTFALGACSAADDVVLGTGPQLGSGGRGSPVNGAAGGLTEPHGAATGGAFMMFPPSSGGGNGAGCGSITAVHESIASEVMVLLDRSGAMAAARRPPASGTWWDAARAAVERLLADPLVSSDGVGVQLYPLSTPDACNADYPVPAHPIQQPAQLRGPLLQTLTTEAPRGKAPLGPALSGILRHVALRGPSSPSRRVLLVTASLPDECEPVDLAGIAAIARDAFENDGVATHVIALNLGDAAPGYDAVAQAGGTAAAVRIEEGDVAAELHDAMRRALLPVPACVWALPEPPSGITGAARERITVTQTRGAEAPRTVPRLGAEAECSPNGNIGWYFLPAPDGGEAAARLCPESCKAMEGGTTLRVTFGCGGVPGN